MEDISMLGSELARECDVLLARAVQISLPVLENRTVFSGRHWRLASKNEWDLRGVRGDQAGNPERRLIRGVIMPGSDARTQ
jgi:hypothetical protein